MLSPTSRALVFAQGLLALGLVASPVSAQDTDAKTKARRPNIVFVFSDDHATNAIGAYGGRLAKLNPTPAIDRLASQGVLFRNSYCTNSICGPSRAVILTGKHSHLNGFTDNGRRFDPDQQTFPKLLQKAGYRTAMFGKWHLGSDPQGFDHWDVLPGQGSYYNPVLRTKDGRRKVEGYVTDIVTELAIDWLEERVADGNDEPFMLMCQHKAPHRNWMPPPEHLDLYDDVVIPEPDTLFDDYSTRASPASYQEMEIDRHMTMVYDLFVPPTADWDPDQGKSLDRSGWKNLQKLKPDQLARWNAAFDDENKAFQDNPPTGRELVRWKYQRYLKNYLRCVRGVDDSVARLMKVLDEKGLADNTVFIYSSDQGFYLGEHGWYDKRWIYEESLEMPLIMRWPGKIAPGTEDRHLVQNLDYAETFLELAGAAIPDDMQGRSLVPLMLGQDLATPWRDAIYYHYHGYPSVHMVARHYGLRTARYKLANFYQFGEWELYDLKEDPQELNNLFGRPEVFGRTAELAELLGRMRQHYADDTDTKLMPVEWQKKVRNR